MTNRLPARRQRGFSIIAVLALFALAGSLFTVWARDALQQRQRTQLSHQRVQAEWLATSALGRAAALRTDNPEYDGEQWELDRQQLGQPYAAEVAISLEPNDAPTTIKVVVRLTLNADRRLQVTRTAPLAQTNPSPQSGDP
ncbi:hypothetical protein Pla123a_33310 [Posidoniimonas polymericola]|uniref:Uncharacterized protein n=1 Tax=Posidoniimonas polymericola TaxID=2528002 RepID=A0A5C5YH46_9BACT|nr:hypothetical protein [Posidoniimonas polymericola]TWT74508.1 hypothetical protein Pla123a_33310 [Posidoniimonas polymericola]